MGTTVRIFLNDLLDVAAGTDEREGKLHRELCSLADEINSALVDYEVTVEHLDTDDFLTFRRREATTDTE